MNTTERDTTAWQDGFEAYWAGDDAAYKFQTIAENSRNEQVATYAEEFLAGWRKADRIDV